MIGEVFHRNMIVSSCLVPALILGTQPVLALADEATVGNYVDTVDSEADTAVFLQADNSKILASVPSEIHVKVNGDGTFITPTANATALKNQSVFSIHVSNITSQFDSPFISASDSSVTSDTNNVITYKIGVAAGDTTSSDSSFSSNADTIILGGDVEPNGWTLTKEGTDGASLQIKHEGSITNVANELDLSVDQSFTTIHWVFTAGVSVMPLETMSWAEIKLMSDDISVNGTSSEYYDTAVALMNSQSTKTLDLGVIEGNGQGDENVSVDVQIIGINHDTKSDGTKAGLTFQITDSSTCDLTYYMNAAPDEYIKKTYTYTDSRGDQETYTLTYNSVNNGTNFGGWESSEMRGWLNNTVTTAIEDALGSNIQLATVQKSTDNEGGEIYYDQIDNDKVSVTNDKVFLLSAIEVYGNSFVNTDYDNSWANVFVWYPKSNVIKWYADEGTQYELYSSLGVTVDSYSAIAANSCWWLRSPGYETTGYSFLTGTIPGDYGAEYSYRYFKVRAAFCL